MLFSGSCTHTLCRLLGAIIITSRARLPPAAEKRARAGRAAVGLASLHRSRSSGFSPPRCYQASSAPSLQYCSRICHPLPPSRFGVASSGRRAVACGRRRQQGRRASLGKTHHLPVSRPASCQVGSPDIRTRLVTSARPPSQHHLAGSLFATDTGSASCFLRTRRFRSRPCLVGVVLPSGHGGPSCSSLLPGTAACASCQAHVTIPRQSRGL